MSYISGTNKLLDFVATHSAYSKSELDRMPIEKWCTEATTVIEREERKNKPKDKQKPK